MEGHNNGEAYFRTYFFLGYLSKGENERDKIDGNLINLPNQVRGLNYQVYDQ